MAEKVWNDDLIEGEVWGGEPATLIEGYGGYALGWWDVTVAFLGAEFDEQLDSPHRITFEDIMRSKGLLFPNGATISKSDSSLVEGALVFAGESYSANFDALETEQADVSDRGGKIVQLTRIRVAVTNLPGEEPTAEVVRRWPPVRLILPA